MENYENIDIKRILGIIFSKKVFIILILLLSIMLGYTYSYYYKKPQYNSSVKILLVADESEENKEVTQTDLTINSSLISTYSSIAKSTNVIEKTIENLGLKMSVSELQNNIEVKQIDKTQFLKISVKNGNPETAKNIANELSKVFSEQIKDIYNLENIKIVDEAEVENIPYNINHTKDMIIFTIGGIFVSAILVMAIYLLDDTIKDEKDIEFNVRLKNIGTLPVYKDNDELVIKNNPKSYIVECIKTTRTNILYAKNKRTILFTSPKQGEGKSWIANNMAVAFAQANKKVILVDTDLRNQSDKNNIFDIEKQEGLSDFIKEISDNKLENLEKSRKYIQETKIPNLHILQNGTIPPNPAELISSNNMKKLLDLLKSMYDIVLLDGTSCMLVSDSIALSSMVDSTILIAENKKTKITDLKKVKKSIEDVNGKILGVISNKIQIQGGKYYGKKYGYYSSEEAEDIEKLEEKTNMISLEDIIKIAENNIKEELLNKKEEIVEENLQIENNILDCQVKIIKDDINKLKKIQTTNNKQLLEKIEKMNHEEKFQEINDKIEKLNNEDKMEKMMQEFMKEVTNSNIEIKNLKELQINSNYQLLEQIEKVNSEEKLEEMNAKIINSREEYERKIEEIKEKDREDITKILQKFMEEVNILNNEIKNLKELQLNSNSELLEKIEKMNYEERLAEINEKIQENKVKSAGNIISFESLKERRKRQTKKSFKINDGINYEDLEKMSTCIIDLNEEIVNLKAMNN
ncbi:MAG: polysaccharide biosynthesis tyrosine autokinase [Clostridia bacterium]|nr:polysaccharide biosynthesis tyrosine autokinase [Clostridia bacterium]